MAAATTTSPKTAAPRLKERFETELKSRRQTENLKEMARNPKDKDGLPKFTEPEPWYYDELGDRRRSGQCAVWLYEHYCFKARPAIAGGWLRRARHALEDDPESAEYGALRLREAREIITLIQTCVRCAK